MLNAIYCDLFGIDDNATEQDIKHAYRQLVRKNHPDLFPDEKKAEQELKMIQLNAAYEQLMHSLHDENPQSAHPRNSKHDIIEGWDYKLHGKDPELSSSAALGKHKDPDYAYYKQGFVHYSEGLGGMMKSFQTAKDIEQMVKKKSYNRIHYSLKYVTTALKKLNIAHGYFKRVVDDFPDSIWCHDAEIKLRRIVKFNDLYKRILKNITNEEMTIKNNLQNN